MRRHVFFVMSSQLCSDLQTNDEHSIMRSNFAIKNLFFVFLAQKNYQQKQGNDIPTIILNLLKRDKVTWTKRIQYGISNCAKNKVKTRPYSIGLLIQKRIGSSAFDEQKVKNIAIKYRLQSIFSNPVLTEPGG